MPSGYVEVGGARLWSEVTGEGPGLALVHAGIADSRMWDAEVAGFSGRFRTMRYDMRGFGRSSPESGRYSRLDDLVAVLEAAGMRRASLVGASLGARVSLELAIVRPDLVEALVLVSPDVRGVSWSALVERGFEEEFEAVSRGDLDRAAEIMVRLWVDGPARKPADVAASTRDLVRAMQRDAYPLQSSEAIDVPLRPPAVERLAEVAAPTLVIDGDADVPDIATRAERLVAGIPNARRVTLRGVAHMLNLERPREFAQLVSEFLS